MKKALAIIGISAVLTITSCQPPQPASPAGPRTWVFNITPQTTIHDIDSVTMAWKKDTIELKITKLEYSDNGKLLKVKGSMKVMPKGTPSGTFSSDSLVNWKLEVDNKQGIILSGK